MGKRVKNKWIFYFLSGVVFAAGAGAQQAYFIDGYHGGIYGHYPEGQTSFIVQKLRQHPDWRVNLEIEPETWDVVKQRDPEGYAAFKQLFKDQSADSGRIEYVNPTYAQSYFFGTSGESVIRQFQYGMRLLRKHFPEAAFTTYSAEEPCFTSCLPAVLKSLGFSYASTKNPNTMWGGYVQAHAGEWVNWVGPDGSRLPTVPRYACEDLQPGSTWQSIAWFNSQEYVRKCLDAGMKHPVGMCLQDAAWSEGWDKGPWLGQDTASFYQPTAYTTWRGYMRNWPDGNTAGDWHFSQEDVLCALMWGTQVMQRLTGEIRRAENLVVQAEKMAAYARMSEGAKWPGDSLDAAWRALLLSQHHDCWIVPYNRLNGGKTWAETASGWTGDACRRSRAVIEQSLKAMAGPAAGRQVRVYNTLAVERNELVAIETPASWKGKNWTVVDSRGEAWPTQWVTEDGVVKLLFRAKVPSAGFATYAFRETGSRPTAPFRFGRRADGMYALKSDLYSLVVDPFKGGSISSLRSASFPEEEWVDRSGDRKFNELRGFFIRENSFLSSTDQPATIRLLEEGPLRMKVCIEGKIGLYPFRQTLTLAAGDPRIEMRVKIDWEGNVQIGEPGIGFKAEDPRKSFYDDRYKLMLYFPTALASPRIEKDAPFDVCESRLEDTFFNRWDSIKHNVIVHWVDKVAKDRSRGLALFSDHTTSYAHGKDFPLALTAQYAGKGLWGREYGVDRATEFTYALLPHRADARRSRLWTRSEERNEPLIPVWTEDKALCSDSFLSIEDEAYELSALYYEGKDLYIRLFNAGVGCRPRQLTIAENKCDIRMDGNKPAIRWVELDGRTGEALPVREQDGKILVDVSVPPFGIRTLRVGPAKK